MLPNRRLACSCSSPVGSAARLAGTGFFLWLHPRGSLPRQSQNVCACTHWSRVREPDCAGWRRIKQKVRLKALVGQICSELDGDTRKTAGELRQGSGREECTTSHKLRPIRYFKHRERNLCLPPFEQPGAVRCSHTPFKLFVELFQSHPSQTMRFLGQFHLPLTNQFQGTGSLPAPISLARHLKTGHSIGAGCPGSLPLHKLSSLELS